VRLRFLCSPVELLGENDRLTQVKIEQNELFDRGGGRLGARGTGHFDTLDSQLLFRSIGYRGTALPGVPFDESWAVVSNDKGRVTDGRGGEVVPRLYTAGWIKRGPVGLIGTNKTDAKETFECMLQDAALLTERAGSDRATVVQQLKARGARPISLNDWQVIDELETANGRKREKIREKFCNSQAMLDALDKARQS
jgi:ferredoxin--NADP+ reductase